MEYVTTDLYLAVYLACSRPFTLRGTTDDSKQREFVFEEDSTIKQDVKDFLSYRGTVVPMRYAQTMKAVKRLLSPRVRGKGGH